VSLLASCASYYPGYSFQPAPDVVSVSPGRTDQRAARVLASVAGVRRADDGRPPEVEVRLRVENLDAARVEVQPQSLVLVTSGLEELGLPRVEPPDVPGLGPGESTTFTAFFPLPPGTDPDDLGLEGLDVRWTLVVDGRRVTAQSSFSRRPPPEIRYVDPFWWHDPWYHHRGFHHRHPFWW